MTNTYRAIVGDHFERNFREMVQGAFHESHNTTDWHASFEMCGHQQQGLFGCFEVAGQFVGRATRAAAAAITGLDHDALGILSRNTFLGGKKGFLDMELIC